MNRTQAVQIWLDFGSRRVEASIRKRWPKHVCDQWLVENAEDVVDGLVALGLLNLNTE